MCDGQYYRVGKSNFSSHIQIASNTEADEPKAAIRMRLQTPNRQLPVAVKNGISLSMAKMRLNHGELCHNKDQHRQVEPERKQRWQLQNIVARFALAYCQIQNSSRISLADQENKKHDIYRIVSKSSCSSLPYRCADDAQTARPNRTGRVNKNRLVIANVSWYISNNNLIPSLISSHLQQLEIYILSLVANTLALALEHSTSRTINSTGDSVPDAVPGCSSAFGDAVLEANATPGCTAFFAVLLRVPAELGDASFEGVGWVCDGLRLRDWSCSRDGGGGGGQGKGEKSDDGLDLHGGGGETRKGV